MVQPLDSVYDLILVVNDTHCGGRTALMPPKFINRAGGTYLSNKFQRWLWQHWEKSWKAAANLKHKDGQLWVVLNGDVFEGLHHRMTELVSNDENEHFKLGIATYEPVLDIVKPDYTFITEGTMVHCGVAHLLEETFAQHIEAEKSGKNSWLWPWLPMDVNGLIMDFAHHGRGGYRPWTKKAAAIRYAAELVSDYGEALIIDRNVKVPRLAFRAHVHYDADSYDNHAIRVIYAPSWQGSTIYGNRLSPGRPLPIGCVAVKVFKDGSYEVVKFYKTPERTNPWRPPKKKK